MNSLKLVLFLNLFLFVVLSHATTFLIPDPYIIPADSQCWKDITWLKNNDTAPLFKAGQNYSLYVGTTCTYKAAINLTSAGATFDCTDTGVGQVKAYSDACEASNSYGNDTGKLCTITYTTAYPYNVTGKIQGNFTVKMLGCTPSPCYSNSTIWDNMKNQSYALPGFYNGSIKCGGFPVWAIILIVVAIILVVVVVVVIVVMMMRNRNNYQNI